MFVTSALDAWVHGWAWARLAWICHHDPAQPGLGGAIAQEPAAIALVAYTLLAFLCAPLKPWKPSTPHTALVVLCEHTALLALLSFCTAPPVRSFRNGEECRAACWTSVQAHRALIGLISFADRMKCV